MAIALMLIFSIMTAFLFLHEAYMTLLCVVAMAVALAWVMRDTARARRLMGKFF